MSAATGGDGAVQPFPWETVLHAGLCLLRLTPDVFWGLSPREFAAMTGGLRGRGKELSRARLDGLMVAFPDR